MREQGREGTVGSQVLKHELSNEHNINMEKQIWKNCLEGKLVTPLVSSTINFDTFQCFWSCLID